jgi:hypothetical protein
MLMNVLVRSRLDQIVESKRVRIRPNRLRGQATSSRIANWLNTAVDKVYGALVVVLHSSNYSVR